MVHLHDGILLSRKKEGAPTLCDSMDGTGEHYTKWNKPGGERQIPYDAPYKWNLVNKTNEQTKYNQRHWNKEQTDGNQRGKSRGIIRERRKGVVKEHNIKDPWTKPKGVGWRVGDKDGWGGGMWWGKMKTTIFEQP